MPAITACPSCGKRNRVPVVATGKPRCAACHHDLPRLVDAGSQDFDAAVRASVPVLVDLWAPWCGPCRTMAPLLEQSSRQRAGRLKVVKVNVDEHPEVSARHQVHKWHGPSQPRPLSRLARALRGRPAGHLRGAAVTGLR